MSRIAYFPGCAMKDQARAYESGALAALLKGKDLQTAVEWGAAHGILVQETPGDISMVEEKQVVAEVKRFQARHGNPDVAFKLATGNVGVMAATNEAVNDAQWPIMACVFGAVIVLCVVSFRSVRGTLCILIPLTLVSLLSYALMTMLEIGLKVSTLPVAALGVGVGVDYGIYLYSRFRTYYKAGDSLRESYFKTLEVTGNGVFFTGMILAIGVATWMFSPLKFQADMGLLLAFLFLMNMVGALVLIPALARFLLDGNKRHQA
jgi:predicted RND superfamily exporter protein